MAPMYYRGASAAILVYDITSEESFTEMVSWMEGIFFRKKAYKTTRFAQLNHRTQQEHVGRFDYSCGR